MILKNSKIRSIGEILFMLKLSDFGVRFAGIETVDKMKNLRISVKVRVGFHA